MRMPRTLGSNCSLLEATIVCFVDLASPFKSVHRGSLWGIMAVDRMSPKLLKFTKAYYPPTNDEGLGK